MNVLLSVKPKFADLIFKGIKKFEYRKAAFGRKDVDKVIVYASSPVKSLVGEFQISEMILDTPESVWSKTSDESGVEREMFFQYFSGKKKACAIGIKHAHKYTSPIDPRDRDPGFLPPQSFRYTDQQDWLTTYS